MTTLLVCLALYAAPTDETPLDVTCGPVTAETVFPDPAGYDAVVEYETDTGVYVIQYEATVGR